MTTSSRITLLALEPRLVFDGALVNTLDQLDALQRQAADANADRARADDASQDLPDAATVDPAAPARRELVVVDGGIANLDAFLQALTSSVERIVVQPGSDGLDQLLAHLQAQGDYDAIHLFGHGSAGVQRLGTADISVAGLRAPQGALARQLGQLAGHLTQDADLLLYGCEVAQGEDGKTLIRELAALTGADIAASTNLTGQGGDWALEVAQGAIEAQALAAPGWQGTLAGEAWYVPPINVLANDTHDNGAINPSSVKLYDATAATGAAGASSVTVAQGTYSVAGNGMVVFTPNASFTGTADAIKYTVTDYDGKVSAFSGLRVGTGDSAPANDSVSTTPSLELFAGSGTGVLAGGAGSGAAATQVFQLLSNTNNPTGVTAQAATGAVPNIQVTYAISNLNPEFKWNYGGKEWDAFMFGTADPGAVQPGQSILGPISGSAGKYTNTLPLKSTGTGIDPATNYGVRMTTYTAGLAELVAQLPDGAARYDTGGRYYYGDLTISFSQAVSNPLLHISSMGAAVDSLGVITELDLSSYQAQGAIKLSKLSGNNAIGANDSQIYNGYGKIDVWNLGADAYGNGTVLASGQGITSMTFRVHLRGDRAGVDPTSNDPQSLWAATSDGRNFAPSGDAMLLGVSLLPRTPEVAPDVMNPVALTVNDLTVNEASPYAVFTVQGFEGAAVKLGLSSGTALAGQDTSAALQYWNGSSWQSYIADSFVTMPGDGDAINREPTQLLVRVAVVNDNAYEKLEKLTLTATYQHGGAATGTLTILDNGQGTIFATKGASDGVGLDGLPLENPVATKDTDGPLKIVGTVINEVSPYLLYTVTANAGAEIQLAMAGGGTAVPGVDTGTVIQYYDGSAWVNYTPGLTLTMPADGRQLMRVIVLDDGFSERVETLRLVGWFKNDFAYSEPSNTDWAYNGGNYIASVEPAGKYFSSFPGTINFTFDGASMSPDVAFFQGTNFSASVQAEGQKATDLQGTFSVFTFDGTNPSLAVDSVASSTSPFVWSGVGKFVLGEIETGYLDGKSIYRNSSTGSVTLELSAPHNYVGAWMRVGSADVGNIKLFRNGVAVADLSSDLKDAFDDVGYDGLNGSGYRFVNIVTDVAFDKVMFVDSF